MEENLIFNDKKFVTTAEAGERLGYTSYYITSFCRDGLLSCKKIGKSWFVEEDSILEFKRKKEIEMEDKRNRLREIRKIEYKKINEQEFTETKLNSEELKERGVEHKSHQADYVNKTQETPYHFVKEEKREDERIENDADSFSGVEFDVIPKDISPVVYPVHKSSGYFSNHFTKIFATLFIIAVLFISGFISVLYIINNQESSKQTYLTKQRVIALRNGVKQKARIIPENITSSLYQAKTNFEVMFNDGLNGVFSAINNITNQKTVTLRDKVRPRVIPENITSPLYQAKTNFEVLFSDSVGEALNAFNKSADSLAAASVPVFFRNMISSVRDSIARWFGVGGDRVATSTAEDTNIVNDINITENSKQNTVQNTAQVSHAVVDKPVIEKVIETKRVVVQSGITESYVLSKLGQLNNKLKSEIYRLSSVNATKIVNNYKTISHTNKIDKLKGVTITSSTFTDGTINGSTSFSGTTGSFSGALSAGSFTVAGVAVLGGITVDTTGLVYDSSTNNIGIGTSTPYAKLSVVGPVVAEYFNATSTTATSTFAGGAMFTRAPTIAHTFSSWATGASASALFDASFVVNPASATADSNLISASVGGSVKFLVDAEGDVFVNNLTSVGETTVSTTTASTFTVEGNTTLGDAITDTTIINGTLTVTGATSVSTVDGNFGVGTTSPWARLSVSGVAGASTPLFTISTTTSGNATSTAIFVDENGKFGIGTTSPSEQLSVEGNALINGTLTSNAITTTGALTGTYVIANSTSATSTFAGGLAVNTSGLVYDYSTGNVGIGTASPTQALEVNGDIKLTGTSKITNGTGNLQINSAASLYLNNNGNAINFGAGLAVLNADGNFGIGTTSPWGKLSVEMDISSPSFVVSNQGSTTPALYISGINQDGVVGIGTKGGSGRRLDVFDAGNPQLRLSQTSSIYTNFQVAASTGDLTIDLNPNTSATDIYMTQTGGTTGANLRVCEGTACPSVTINNGGNVLVENAVYFGNGFRIDQVVGTTTEIAIYGVTTTTTPIIIFDEF